MKQILLTLICILSVNLASYAQCDHDPTITPDTVMLCGFPHDTLTLWTQSYDSYQWYKDGILIPGATNQHLSVNSADLWSNISVQTTDAGCSEMSPSVFIDANASIPIHTMIPSDNVHSVTAEGVVRFCVGDTARISVGLPWTENIQWTVNGDTIPPSEGGNSQTIEVTSPIPTGVLEYDVCAGNTWCPYNRQCMGSGMAPRIQFIACPLSVNESLESNLSYRIFPNPANSFVTIQINPDHLGASYKISNQLGTVILSGELNLEHTKINVQDLSTGIYFVEIGNNNTFKLIKK